MPRRKEKLLAMLREQRDLLHNSLNAFHEGSFAESLRIATTLRVLVHETGRSKPLLAQARPDGLDLQIPEQADQARPDKEEVVRFVVSIRLGPGPAVAPAVDLDSSHYSLRSVGSWWNRTVFTFPSRAGTSVSYTRRQVVLILANKEGGAHVDPDEDTDYIRLAADQPLAFEFDGARLDTPDLARILSAQSGIEMLKCLQQNFFPDSEVPSKWELGPPPPSALYMDQLSLEVMRVLPAFPRAQIRLTKRS